MIDATVQPSNPANRGSTWIRVLSAAVLAPVVLAALYFGMPYSEILILVAAALLAWEWAALCDIAAPRPAGLTVIAAIGAAVACGAIREYEIAGWLVAVGAMAAAVAASREGAERSFWAGFGVVYLAVPCLGLLWLRQFPSAGLALVFWLLFVVWATDTAAYFAGRAIGGPKLAPAISPKKTWSGFIGGLLAAALAGVALGLIFDSGQLWVVAAASALVSVVAQMGDLIESGIKRRFGVKDSGRLIPGHGGLLDRVDGLLTASLVVAILVWHRGTAL